MTRTVKIILYCPPKNRSKNLKRPIYKVVADLLLTFFITSPLASILFVKKLPQSRHLGRVWQLPYSLDHFLGYRATQHWGSKLAKLLL